MPEGQQDKRGVSVTVTAYPPGSLDEALNLVAGQVFPRSSLNIRDPPGRNFPMYGMWGRLPRGLNWQEFGQFLGPTLPYRALNGKVVEECLPVNLRWPLGRDLRKDGLRALSQSETPSLDNVRQIYL